MTLSSFRQAKTVYGLDDFPKEAIIIQRKAGLRTVRWRFDRLTHQLYISLPSRLPDHTLQKVLPQILNWYHQERALHRPIPLQAPHLIPVHGVDKRICHQIEGRSGVQEEEAILYVTSHQDDQERVITKWLKHKAYGVLTAATDQYAQQLDVSLAGLTIRETGSRWGSCSAQGHLSFSWRLIFAPLEVLHYVAAHEVAHRCHMNHSKAFWHTVASICPLYQTHRHWLKQHGGELFRYGIKTHAMKDDR